MEHRAAEAKLVEYWSHLRLDEWAVCKRNGNKLFGFWTGMRRPNIEEVRLFLVYIELL